MLQSLDDEVVIFVLCSFCLFRLLLFGLDMSDVSATFNILSACV